MNTGDRSGSRYGQAGSAAVEFAFVFPILLALVYATVVYGYLFVVRESIEFAAHKGLEAAVAVDPSATNATAEQGNQAKIAVNCSLNWLTGQACGTATSTAGRVETTYVPGSGGLGCPLGYGCVTVTYYVQQNGDWVFPKLIGLPMVGTIPPLPTTMTATAVAEIS